MKALNAWMIIVLATLTGCATAPQSEAEVFDDVVQLTSGYARAGEAYFSSDMKWVIYQATPPGEANYAMFIARLLREADAPDGRITGLGQPIRVTPPGTRNTCGFFSPDGVSVIFASTKGRDDADQPPAGYQRKGRDYRWSFPAGMEIFRADGWQGAVAAAEFSKGIDLAEHKITDNSAYDAECAYSPDGKWIVFASNRDADPLVKLSTTQPGSRDLDLYAMRADGTNVVRLTTAPGYDGGPFFSPDGRRLVYRSDRLNNNLLQIFTADLTFDSAGNITGLKNEQQLTQDANVNWGPFWHPAGRHIVYASSAIAHTNYELFLMAADGRKNMRITFAAGADILPAFSPDGRHLMWTSQRATDKSSQLFIAKFKMPAAAK